MSSDVLLDFLQFLDSLFPAESPDVALLVQQAEMIPDLLHFLLKASLLLLGQEVVESKVLAYPGLLVLLQNSVKIVVLVGELGLVQTPAFLNIGAFVLVHLEQLVVLGPTEFLGHVEFAELFLSELQGAFVGTFQLQEFGVSKTVFEVREAFEIPDFLALLHYSNAKRISFLRIKLIFSSQWVRF